MTEESALEQSMLTDEQRAKFRRHIELKWTRGCPMCGANHWLPVFATTMPVGIRKGVPMTHTLPQGLAICRECGFSALVNLLIAGVIDAEP